MQPIGCLVRKQEKSCRNTRLQ